MPEGSIRRVLPRVRLARLPILAKSTKKQIKIKNQKDENTYFHTFARLKKGAMQNMFF